MHKENLAMNERMGNEIAEALIDVFGSFKIMAKVMARRL